MPTHREKPTRPSDPCYTTEDQWGRQVTICHEPQGASCVRCGRVLVTT